MRRLLVLALAAVLAPPPSAPAGRADPQPPLRLGGAPLELVGTPDSLWVLTCERRCSGEGRRSEGRIVRLDPRSGRVHASVRIGRPHALAVGPRGVYTLDFWRGTVRRLDPRTLETRGTVRLVLPFEISPGDRAFLPFDVAVGENAVWVATARGALARVDPEVTRVLAIVSLRGQATTGSIAAGRGGVWVAESLLGVYRVDPATNRVAARIRIGSPGARLAVEAIFADAARVLAVGSWTAGGALTGRRGLARIDAATSRVEAVTPLPSGALAVAYGKGSLWVARAGGASVDRIDPGTGRLVRSHPTRGVAALALAGGSLWGATRDGTIRRIATP